MKACNDK
jgi:sodium/potassium/calcium exchanger 6